MTTFSDIIKRVGELLKELYHGVTRYGNETVDLAVPPYFFVECVPIASTHHTRNLVRRQCTVFITYMPKVLDQVDNLKKTDEIFEALGMVLVVGDRRLLVIDYSHEYIGESNNIIQISFNLDWWEKKDRPGAELITSVDMKGQVNG